MKKRPPPPTAQRAPAPPASGGGEIDPKSVPFPVHIAQSLTERHPSPAWRAEGRRLRTGGLALALLAAFALLTLLVRRGATDRGDDAFLRWTQAHLLPHAAWFWQAISWPGYAPQSFGISIFFVLLAWWYGNRRGLALMLVAALASPLNSVIKQFVGRPRPTPEQARVIGEIPASAAYPSGHVVMYTVLCGLLILIIRDALPVGRRERRREWVVCGILAAAILLVGPARVALGHHWPTDALGGYLLAGAFLISLARWRRVPSLPPAVSEASACL